MATINPWQAASYSRANPNFEKSCRYDLLLCLFLQEDDADFIVCQLEQGLPKSHVAYPAVAQALVRMTGQDGSRGAFLRAGVVPLLVAMLASREPPVLNAGAESLWNLLAGVDCDDVRSAAIGEPLSESLWVFW